ncbi:MAG: mechanosensitive ion channel family protein [Rhizobiales bacterium]|nr:mechanosensitive ion channel family protein [Hyphomicrobiales bacterium]
MRHLSSLAGFIGALVWLAVQVTAAGAVDAGLAGQAERAAENFRSELTQIQRELVLPTLSDDQLSQHRGNIEKIRAGVIAQALALGGPIAEIKAQLAKIGPEPAAGQSEAEGITAQRKELTETLQRLEGAKKQLELISVEAEQTGARAAALQKDRFFSRIFEPGRSVFNPDLWADSAAGAGQFVQRLIALLDAWWNAVRADARLSVLLLIPAIFAGAFLAYEAGARWLRRRFLASSGESVPDDLARLWRVVRGTVLTAAAIFVTIFAVWSTIGIAGVSTPRFDMLLRAIAQVAFETIVIGVLARRVASPGDPAWRLIDVDNTAATRLVALVTAIAFVTAAQQALSTVASNLFLPLDYSVGQSTVATIILIILLALVLVVLRRQPGLGDDKGDRRLYFGWTAQLAPLAWIILAVSLVALAAGYLALGQFLVTQLFETARLIACLYLLHRLAEAAITKSFDPQSRPGVLMREATGLGERGIERWGAALRTIADIALVVVGVPAILIQLTLTWIDLRGLGTSLLVGFQLGDVTISPATLLLALAVLGGGILLTKVAVRWFNNRILEHSRLDKGVQDSLRKAGSYAGYVAAAGFALNVAGLDFSNLAIIAGAFGVGIGLGLQPIVNNFISGLILLVERPIRIGDWVSLPGGEGIVKRINGRATEIETFDSCTIIVPNSDLITKPVNNWTHDDTIGRFTVSVGVAYNSDVDDIRNIMLEIAKAHRNVLTYPEPTVLLTAFALNSMTFQLRGHVADIFEAAVVASDIRLSLVKAFRDKGIVMPVPQ